MKGRERRKTEDREGVRKREGNVGQVGYGDG